MLTRGRGAVKRSADPRARPRAASVRSGPGLRPDDHGVAHAPTRPSGTGRTGSPAAARARLVSAME